MLFWLKFIANTVALMIGNHTLGTNVTRTSFAEVLCLLLRMDQAKLINKTLLRLNVRIINKIIILLLGKNFFIQRFLVKHKIDAMSHFSILGKKIKFS